MGMSPWAIDGLAVEAGGADALVRRRWLRGPAPSAGVDYEGAIGARRGLHGLLEQAVEEHASGARASAVEAERELVQVCLYVPGLDAALVSAQQPALCRRGPPVHAGEWRGPWLAGRADRLGLMRVVLATRRPVAREPIGDHDRARLNVVEHERPQRRAGDIGDHLEPAG